MRRVPLFPLPGTVFFPGVRLPLHIFEPRYREMMEDTLDGSQHMVIVLLKPGWDRDYHGCPPVHEVATVGVVEEYEKLPDARYNLVVKGVEKVRLLDPAEPDGGDLVPGKGYRARWIRPIAETTPKPGSIEESQTRIELLQLWKQLVEEAGLKDREHGSLTAYAPFDQLVNQAASLLDLPPAVKQELLECNDLLERARSILSHLEEQVLHWSTIRRFRNLAPEDPRLN